jgi:Protein of unknown function (DUF3179)
MQNRVLHFYLAGINNQNFLMRDRETGTWWQQVSGLALFGPLQGARLERVVNDEITFASWKSEFPAGQVLAPIAKFSDKYEKDWETSVGKLPVVVSFPGQGLADRDVIIGLSLGNEARAYPLATVLKQSPIQDQVGGVPILLAVGPDKQSLRAFISRDGDQRLEFFQKPGAADWTLIDTSGSEWNFKGCATSGAKSGKCLEQIVFLKDYWFDWRNYHPTTSVYRH